MNATTVSQTAYFACVEKLLRLHALSVAGRDERPEAEALRAEMDPLWYALSEAERRRIGALSEDLAAIAEGGAEPVEMSAEERRTYDRRLAAAEAVGDWDAGLAVLRRTSPDLSRQEVIRHQARFWGEAATSDVANVFLREAERLAENGEQRIGGCQELGGRRDTL